MSDKLKIWPDTGAAIQKIKITKLHTDFQTAGLTNDIEIWSAPAGCKIRNTFIDPRTAFAGTAISGYTISVGIAGELDLFNDPLNVMQTAIKDDAEAPGIESWGSATSIRAAATSVGANLDQSTAGKVIFYIYYSQVQ